MKLQKFDEFIALNELGDLKNVIPFEFKFIKGRVKAQPDDEIIWEFYPKTEKQKLEPFWCNFYFYFSEYVLDDFADDLGLIEAFEKSKLTTIMSVNFESSKTGYLDKDLDLKFANRVMATIFEIIKANDEKFKNIGYVYQGSDLRRHKYYTNILKSLADINKYEIDEFKANNPLRNMLFYKK